ncbi:MAG: dihydroorotate dehydrogenase, partial [Bacillota bacterium]|nr:dihydroorotate dehydrogenase [Bacillota bacterium]
MAVINTAVELAGIKLKNPVLTASGTFGYGHEYAKYFDLSRLGALVVKTLTLEPRKGNPPPRIAETPCGMLNAVGLENPGAAYFVREILPDLKQYPVPLIVSIAGCSVDEYATMARLMTAAGSIDALEVNISCPNVKAGGIAFGTVPEMAAEVIRAVRLNTDLPVIAKLTPNVTDIAGIAVVVVEAGADAVSLINTVTGMVIDIERRRPVLANQVGGLSGPAVRPIAVRAVWQVYRAVKVPIIGMGGIMEGRDALEFMLAGAQAVA